MTTIRLFKFSLYRWLNRHQFALDFLRGLLVGAWFLFVAAGLIGLAWMVWEMKKQVP